MIRTGKIYFMKDNVLKSSAYVYGNYNGTVRRMRIYVDNGKTGPSSIEDLEYMQDWADLDSDTKTAFKNAMTEGQVYTLTDKRDSHPYKIAKLKDGNIWMVENLRLANYTCKPEDSDITSGTFQLPASSGDGFSKSDVANVYVDNTYGGYYTWFAATAGEGSSSKSSGSCTRSIAPKGWRLPDKSTYETLVSKYPTGLKDDPVPHFQRGGNCGSQLSSANNVGFGFYWTCTAYSTYYAYRLHIDNEADRYNRVTYEEKYCGCNVRCIAR